MGAAASAIKLRHLSIGTPCGGRLGVSGCPPPPCNARPDRHDAVHIGDVETHIWSTI